MKKRKEPDLPCGCKPSKLGYLAWHDDAERRHKKGERQVWCTGCMRWRFADEIGHERSLTLRQFNKRFGVVR